MTRLPTTRRFDRAAPLAVIAICLALYVATLMPGAAFDDWGEMQTVPHVLGVTHPTGYPTYILTAWAFELLPLGSVAWRANLLSAVCVAIALGTLTAIGGRVGVRPWLAAVAALATGAVATVWSSAVIAEVNPLHLALMALLIHRSLVWADELRLRDLALGGLLVGLGLGNHLLTAFVAPFFIGYALWAGRHRLVEKPAWILAPVLAAAGGLAVYAYIPIAAALGPPLVYNDPVTIDRLRFLVTGEQFRNDYDGLFTATSLSTFAASLGDLVRLSAAKATPILPVVGLIGLALLVRRRIAFGLACWGALVAGLIVWANYLRLEHYLLVPWLLIGIGAGVALDAAVNGVLRVLGGRPAGRAVPAVAGVLGAALVVALVCGQPAGREPERRPVGTGVRRHDARRAPAGRRDPVLLGRVDAAVARAPCRGPAARRPRRRRHEHRVRGLGLAGGAHRRPDLRTARVHHATVPLGPRCPPRPRTG